MTNMEIIIKKYHTEDDVLYNVYVNGSLLIEGLFYEEVEKLTIKELEILYLN